MVARKIHNVLGTDRFPEHSEEGMGCVELDMEAKPTEGARGELGDAVEIDDIAIEHDDVRINPLSYPHGKFDCGRVMEGDVDIGEDDDTEGCSGVWPQNNCCSVALNREASPHQREFMALCTAARVALVHRCRSYNTKTGEFLRQRGQVRRAVFPTMFP